MPRVQPDQFVLIERLAARGSADLTRCRFPDADIAYVVLVNRMALEPRKYGPHGTHRLLVVQS